MTFAIKASPSMSQRTASSKIVGVALIEGSTATSALSNPAIATSKPTTAAIDTSDFALVRLMFGGTTTANQIINYQVIGWRPVFIGDNEYWVPQLLAKGAATLGATIIPTAVVANGLMADTISNTLTGEDSDEDAPADDSIAMLAVPVEGSFVVTVETDLDTAVTAYVFAQLGE